MRSLRSTLSQLALCTFLLGAAGPSALGQEAAAPEAEAEIAGGEDSTLTQPSPARQGSEDLPVATAEPDDEMPSEESARAYLMEDVREYLDAIAALEETGGAYAPGLTEQLLGLGLALQRNGAHDEAVETFKRGVHLSRITDGLHSSRQLALLQGEIASHIAMGAFATADERQRYLFRVQAQTLSDVPRGQAYMQHALWQRQAYEAGVGEDPFARLLRMWSLYRLALTEYIAVEGQESPKLLPPLYGMLRSQYLLSGMVPETTSGRFRTRGIYGEEENKQVAFRSQAFKQGSAVIQAIYDLKKVQPGASWRDDAEYVLMTADWNLWHGKRSDAFELYGQLFGELSAIEGAESYRDQIFAAPTPLPSIDGVRGLPAPQAELGGRLLLEFGVTDRGRAVDVIRADEYLPNDEKASNIIRRVRQTIFRPQFSDGMPVDTEGLRWAYDTSQWISE